MDLLGQLKTEGNTRTAVGTLRAPPTEAGSEERAPRRATGGVDAATGMRERRTGEAAARNHAAALCWDISQEVRPAAVRGCSAGSCWEVSPERRPAARRGGTSGSRRDISPEERPVAKRGGSTSLRWSIPRPRRGAPLAHAGTRRQRNTPIAPKPYPATVKLYLATMKPCPAAAEPCMAAVERR